MMAPTMTASVAALTALGASWRGDWSDFDGRTLRAQLEEIAEMVGNEARGQDMRRELAGFFAANGICPQCQSWTEHCNCERSPR